MEKKHRNQVGDGTNGGVEGWKWWGWSSGPMNPEEVQRVHVLQRNAGGGGKPLLPTWALLSK